MRYWPAYARLRRFDLHSRGRKTSDVRTAAVLILLLSALLDLDASQGKEPWTLHAFVEASKISEIFPKRNEFKTLVEEGEVPPELEFSVNYLSDFLGLAESVPREDALTADTLLGLLTKFAQEASPVSEAFPCTSYEASTDYCAIDLTLVRPDGTGTIFWIVARKEQGKWKLTAADSVLMWD